MVNVLLKKNSQKNSNTNKIISLKQKLEVFYKLNKKKFKKQLKKLQNLKSIFKFYIKLQKKKYLLKLKKKKKKKFKLKLKKKLDLFLKNFLLSSYSLINIIKLNKKEKNLKLKRKYLLYININSNNIFINFLYYKEKKIKIIKFWSCGLFKLHCTKRKLKFILYTLLKEIKKKLKYISFFIIKIFCAHFLHKYLYKNFKKLFFKSKFIIFTSFKIFNGCRSKKKRRKKHLKFRIYR